MCSDVPGPPTGPIEFNDISANSITLNWQPPEDTGGSEIGNYVVDYREFGRATWSSVTSCITRTSIKVTIFREQLRLFFFFR